jgi:hypothetical protein
VSNFVGTYVDSIYGEAIVTLEGNHLELRRGDWHGPLEYWNATNFRWTMGPTATGPLFIKFEVSPDGRVTGLNFGIGGDISLMARKAASGRGGRGGGGSNEH